MDDAVFFLRMQLAFDELFWSTSFLVKASFLALIWSIFNVSARFRKAWRLVAIYTFLTFWAIFLSEFWQCGTPSTYDNPEACNTIYLTQINAHGIYTRFALSFSSSLFILALPIVKIRKLHMPFGKKIAVAAVFALVIIDIMVSVARNVSAVLATVGYPTDVSGSVDVIGGSIEPSIAVLVCSLPPYRALVFKLRSRRGDSYIIEHDGARVHRSAWLPRKLQLLTASIASPFLEITIMQEPTSQATARTSEEILVEAPETVSIPEREAEKKL